MSKKADSPIDSEEKKVQRFESKYNPRLLRECINEGMTAADIMTKLDIKHRQTLKQYVLKLMSDDKTYYEVKELYLKNSRRPKINNKLELKVYLKNLDLQGLIVGEGDEFSIEVIDGRIVLTKV